MTLLLPDAASLCPAMAPACFDFSCHVGGRLLEEK